MRSFWFANCWWRFKERERGRIWRTSSLRKGKKARWFSQTAIIVKCEIVELLKIKRPIKDMLENNFAYFHPPWNWSQHCSANQCLSDFVFLWVEMEVIVFSILKPCWYPQFISSGRQSLAWNIVVPDGHWWWVKFCFSHLFSDFGTGLGTLSAFHTCAPPPLLTPRLPSFDWGWRGNLCFYFSYNFCLSFACVGFETIWHSDPLHGIS